MAQELNIDVQKAQEIQAKLLPNPIFTADFNVYDPQNKKFLHTGNTGQKSFQIEQLIRIGGKRQNEILLAKSNTAIAQLVFHDWVRQLKYQLHITFFELGEQNRLITQYNNRMSMLDSIIIAFEKQVSKGNIPLKDLVRLKSLYIDLSNEKMELQKNGFEKLSQLQVILQTKSYVYPLIENTRLSQYDKIFQEQELLKIALENRPDYQACEQNKQLTLQHLDYQKKLAVPDVVTFASYDQRGGAFTNQINAGLSIPVPFFNRNQGAIQSARIQSQIADLNLGAMKLSIEADITKSLNLYNVSNRQYQKILSMYSNDFDFTFNSISTNFQKRNITLLEFVDFFEAYNSASHELIKAKLQLCVAVGMLNYNVSKNLFE